MHVSGELIEDNEAEVWPLTKGVLWHSKNTNPEPRSPVSSGARWINHLRPGRSRCGPEKARRQRYIYGKLVGQTDIPLTMPIGIGLAGDIVCGADTGASVTPNYTPPFKFTGTLYGVTVDVSGELIKDEEAEMRVIMARQ